VEGWTIVLWNRPVSEKEGKPRRRGTCETCCIRNRSERKVDSGGKELFPLLAQKLAVGDVKKSSEKGRGKGGGNTNKFGISDMTSLSLDSMKRGRKRLLHRGGWALPIEKGFERGGRCEEKWGDQFNSNTEEKSSLVERKKSKLFFWRCSSQGGGRIGRVEKGERGEGLDRGSGKRIGRPREEGLLVGGGGGGETAFLVVKKCAETRALGGWKRKDGGRLVPKRGPFSREAGRGSA